MGDRIELLRASELFCTVPEPLLERIEPRLVERRLARGTVLFHEGDPGDAVYLVAEGVLSLEAVGVPLLRRVRGECVGEFALIDGEPRSATALAATDVVLLAWSREDFRVALATDPDVARGIFRMLTAKLRQDVDRRVDSELERERWRQDLARAREIQTGMLPPARLEWPSLEVAGYCAPATEVGGDWFDYVCFDRDRVGLVIGDVTGHGFYSGLFVAMAKACVHTQARFDFAPARIMDALRRTLELSLHRRLLMSCCYVLLDAAAGTLRYANAGHPPPYLYRGSGGDVARLDALDPLVGVLGPESGEFAERTLEWGAGDVLVGYTDGVTETRDAAGEEFGDARLEACVVELAAGGPDAITSEVVARLAVHAGVGRQSDDVTVVAARAR